MLSDRQGDPGGDLRAASDEALLERVKARDTRAHRTLFERFYARLFAFVQRRVNDGALADELVADVFFEVWRNADRFRGESRVSTWLFGIANFKTMAALRQGQRGIRGATGAMNPESLQRVEDRRDLSAALEARGELRRLQSLIGDLPDGQREAVELVFVEGMPYGEAAQRLGVPEATIKTRISRARSRLRREMTGRAAIGGRGHE